MKQFKRLKSFISHKRWQITDFLQEKFDPAANAPQNSLSDSRTRLVEALLFRERELALDSSPKLIPRRTMLFYSIPSCKECNALTAHYYRKKIRSAYFLSREHGITTYLVEYSGPLGLLALETLLSLRDEGEEFTLYCVAVRGDAASKSYRLLPETTEERLQMQHRCDYNYFHVSRTYFESNLRKGAGISFSEKGFSAP